MREVRAMFLATSAASLGLKPTKEYPRGFGAGQSVVTELRKVAGLKR